MANKDDRKIIDTAELRLHVSCDSVRALLAETNVKLSRVGGLHAVDTSTSHDKRAGIGGMQLDTQLEELRNLQTSLNQEKSEFEKTVERHELEMIAKRRELQQIREDIERQKAELRQESEELHYRRHHQQQMRASSSSHSSDGGTERHQGAKMASSVSSSSAAAAAAATNNASSPGGSPRTRRTAPRILPSILGRFTSHRSASSDRLKRCTQRRTESSENINTSLNSSPGSPASVGGPSSPSRPWESHLMVWDSRSALLLNQDDASTVSHSTDVSPGDAAPAPADDDFATSPASTGPSSDGSCRLQPWRSDVIHHHQQQQSEWTLDLASSEQSSRRSSTVSTATVNSDAPTFNP